MSLLSERDRTTVQTHLAGLTHDVTLLFFTQTIGAPETVTIARQVGFGLEMLKWPKLTVAIHP